MDRRAEERRGSVGGEIVTLCERCGKKVIATTMSVFNTETICVGVPDSCKERERRHPKYEEARAAEVAAVRGGNFNFPGIGRPADL